MRALITGGRGGIGRAIAEAYEGEVVALDLPEFDVASPDAWTSLEGEFDAAFLNAGIGIGFIFGKEIESVARQPEMKDELQSIRWLGFALTEAVAFYTFIFGLIAFFL